VPAAATGALAGSVAAVVVLASAPLERRLTGREPSDLPNQGVRATLGLHLAHGAVYGAVHGLARAAGAGPVLAAGVHAGAMAVGDTAGLGVVGLVPLSHRWESTDAAAVAGRKALHAAATAVALAVIKLGVSRSSC